MNTIAENVYSMWLANSIERMSLSQGTMTSYAGTRAVFPPAVIIPTSLRDEGAVRCMSFVFSDGSIIHKRLYDDQSFNLSLGLLADATADAAYEMLHDDGKLTFGERAFFAVCIAALVGVGVLAIFHT